MAAATWAGNLLAKLNLSLQAHPLVLVTTPGAALSVVLATGMIRRVIVVQPFAPRGSEVLAVGPHLLPPLSGPDAAPAGAACRGSGRAVRVHRRHQRRAARCQCAQGARRRGARAVASTASWTHTGRCWRSRWPWREMLHLRATDELECWVLHPLHSNQSSALWHGFVVGSAHLGVMQVSFSCDRGQLAHQVPDLASDHTALGQGRGLPVAVPFRRGRVVGVRGRGAGPEPAPRRKGCRRGPTDVPPPSGIRRGFHQRLKLGPAAALPPRLLAGASIGHAGVLMRCETVGGRQRPSRR